MYRAFLPGRRLWRGTEAYLSSNLAGQISRPPPRASSSTATSAAAATQPDHAGLAALGSFLFPTIGRLLLPVDALVAAARHRRSQRHDPVGGRISLLVTVVAGIAGYYFLRGERSARWLGAKLQRPPSWTLVKAKRDPIRRRRARAAQLRTNTLAVRTRDGSWDQSGRGQPAVTYLILLAALRFVGVSGSELSAAEAFAAFAIAFWAGVVLPITGAASASSTRPHRRARRTRAAPPTTRSSPRRSCGASSTRSSAARPARSR